MTNARRRVQPARTAVLIERLVFVIKEASRSGRRRPLEVDGTHFEALVATVVCPFGIVDLGGPEQQQLGAAGDAVFNAKSAILSAPCPATFGPAIVRVNGRAAVR